MGPSKKALITGASKGIGKALAQQFIQQGFDIICVSRSEPDYKVCQWIQADLTKPEDRRNVLKTLHRESLAPDILINNAGRGLYDTWETTDSADEHALMELNFFSYVDLTRLLLPLLKQQKGTIINTSSVAAILPVACMGIYCASKAAVSMFSETLRMEVKPYNVHVIDLIVGRIDTGFSNGALGNKNVPSSPGKSNTEDLARKVYKAYANRKKRLIFPGWYRFMPILYKLFHPWYTNANIKKWNL